MDGAVVWKEVLLTKRVVIPEKVLHDPEEARRYAASSARRGQRLGRLFVRLLLRMGFKRGRILDVGTGSGQVPLELAYAFPEADVVGIDLSEPLLELARSAAKKAGLEARLSFRKGDVQEMPFFDHSFDVVVSLNTLHVVDNPVTMLNEMERVLSPVGILLLSDIKRSWLGWFMPALRTAYTTAELKRLLQQSKLRPWKLSESLFWHGVSTGETRNSSRPLPGG
jgi:ubiquinone/menaquinone biosynthesis C-methylase UbiE